MARKKKAIKKKSVAAVPTSRRLSLSQLARIGACEDVQETFRSLFGNEVMVTPAIVDRMNDGYLVAFGRPSSWWLLSSKGQKEFSRARVRNRKAHPESWNLGYPELCRRYLRLLARYYIRYPRRFPRSA